MNIATLRGGLRLHSILLLGVTALAGSGLTTALAVDGTWTGGGANQSFTNGQNWQDGNVPGNSGSSNADAANFGSTGDSVVNFTAPNSLPTSPSYFLGSILFGSASSAYTFNATGTTPTNFELGLSSASSGAIRISQSGANLQKLNIRLALTPGAYTFANDATATGATLNFSQQIRSTNTANATSSLTLTGANTSANTISGNIVNGKGAGMSVSKTDAGTWVLSGANTYTGVTTVGGGTLLVNNTNGSGTGSGAVTVNNSGTILGGKGTITGPVTVAVSGARLRGGDGSSASGALTLSNNLSLASGSLIELAFGSSGTHSTLARTGGTWSFDAGQMFSPLNFGAQPGTYDNIITGLANDPGNVGSWSFTAASGFVGTFSYDGFGDIDVNITAVPEPGTILAGLLAFGTLGYSQRRRLRMVVSAMRGGGVALVLTV